MKYSVKNVQQIISISIFSHPKLLTVPSELFYEGELEPKADPFVTHSMLNWMQLPNKKVPLVFHGVVGKKVLIFLLGFPTGRDSATFRDKETEVPSLSRVKGTTGKAKILAKGGERPGQTKFGTGRAGTAKIRDGTGWDSQKPGRDVGQNGTEQKRTF